MKKTDLSQPPRRHCTEKAQFSTDLDENSLLESDNSYNYYYDADNEEENLKDKIHNIKARKFFTPLLKKKHDFVKLPRKVYYKSSKFSAYNGDYSSSTYPSTSSMSTHCNGNKYKKKSISRKIPTSLESKYHRRKLITKKLRAKKN